MTIDPVLTVFTPQAAPQNAVSVTVVAAPPGLPTRIQGEVVQSDPKAAQAIIRTAQGDVVIQTDAALQVGQKVDMRLPPVLPQTIPGVPTPSPAPQAPIVAVLIPQPLPQTPSPPPSLPPAIHIDVADALPSTQIGSPAPTNYQLPVQTPAAAQPLTQLVGQDIAATLLRPAAPLPSVPVPGQAAPYIPTEAAPGSFPTAAQPVATGGVASPVSPAATPVAGTPATAQGAIPGGVPHFAVIAPQGTPLSPFGGERVQIAFIGSLTDATDVLQKMVQQQTGSTPMVQQPGIGMQTGLSGGLLGMMRPENLSFPVLAQFIGVTPQKLPVFETLPFPSGLMPGFVVADAAGDPLQTLLGQAQQTIQPGTRVIAHIPILNTQPLPDGINLAALQVSLPPAQPSAAEKFALETLPHLAPLLSQLMQDPGSVLPPALTALTAQAASIVPRPGTPRFAMNMAMALLGLTAGEPTSVLPKSILDVLKPDQKAQLQKELQALQQATRDGAQQAEGLRVNLPVEMGGQLYLWQMTMRSDRDGHLGAAGGGEKPTRFILDFYMSNMGEMQVDGLSFAQSRRLDLVLRSKMNFDESTQKLLQQEAYAVLDRAGLVGSFEYQNL